ncbi:MULTISPECIES: 2-hydroxyacid dehydrogenase [unclassified Bacillus (in: firmicutes)]|uniref:2-hydroxyacid dehydrogenase n=1 Tax=unclassified Bacillus (in: firmicutes) TaxID=185979 RepID=UPI002281AD1F|nr:2-hydroxyacid dehydrogenase [Bacillus sp. S20C3]MCY8287676.1 2-hydroxyacid dehydrogenase [Bacillus sp. N13C7]MCY8639785.1 2-hydroxyacid dehydrogenase [Bacillus sp. S17B2]MCY9142815.1 2-hydroxyacid dehydrogenase [Bacillus sp. T9C1]
MKRMFCTMTVLVTAPYNEEGRKELKNLFGSVAYHSWKEQGRAYREKEMIQLLKETNAIGLITELDQVTDSVFTSVPDLSFVGVCRGMPSNVDVAAASKRGIPVFYTPGRNAQAVAEMFIGNMISFLRHTSTSNQWLKDGKWDSDYLQAYVKFKGNELSGKTVGMVGFGAVGQRIAKLLTAFDCQIKYYDPYVQDDHPLYQKVSLKTVFSDSDIVSIHLPRTEETLGLIDQAYFDLMKESAIFVNTSRAVVVNREDLLSVLKKHKIRGAILDVFYHEPPEESDYELISLPNVLATPHLAGATFEVEDHHVAILNEALKKWKDEKTLNIPTLYNKVELKTGV